MRSTLNNAIRPPLRKSVTQLHSSGRYKAISNRWRFTQETVSDGASYALINDSFVSRYLIPGTRPHDIEMPPHNAPIGKLLQWARSLGIPFAFAYIALAKIARDGQTMHHPGIKPDTQVLSILRHTEEEVHARVHDYMARWSKMWGQEGIGG
jgi:hypothetical protein